MQAIEILKRDHELILEALGVLAGFAAEVRNGGSPAEAAISPLLDFFRSFADGCHHAKEEDALFPLLEARGMPRKGGPIGVMLAEHEHGRKLILELAASSTWLADSTDARHRFVAAASAYDELLRSHIHRENEVLFRLAERLLEPADDAGLVAHFQRLERGVAPGERDRLHRLLHKLRAA